MNWRFIAVFRWIFVTSIFTGIGMACGFADSYLAFMWVISYIGAGLDLRSAISDLLTPEQSFKMVVFWLPSIFSENVLKWILT